MIMPLAEGNQINQLVWDLYHHPRIPAAILGQIPVAMIPPATPQRLEYMIETIPDNAHAGQDMGLALSALDWCWSHNTPGSNFWAEGLYGTPEPLRSRLANLRGAALEGRKVIVEQLDWKTVIHASAMAFITEVMTDTGEAISARTMQKIFDTRWTDHLGLRAKVLNPHRT